MSEIYILRKHWFVFFFYYFLNKIGTIQSTNLLINNQMKVLSKNIIVLETIEINYGNLDNFVKKNV